MKKMLTYAPRGVLALDPKAWGLEFAVIEDSGASREPFTRVGDAAVVCIPADGSNGPLVSKCDWRFDSYEAIQERMAAAFASDARRVIMKIDSPGGDVAGCFELAAWMRAEARKSGKELIAFTDGKTCSAAYALASSADRFVITPTATIGSIGVIDAMVDLTAQDVAMGVRFAFVASGARKTDGNPHVAISEDALATMQANVLGLAQLFFDLVEAHRGMPAAQVAALEAGTFFGANAVALGLADVTMTWPELVSGNQGESGDKQMTVKAQTGAGGAQAKASPLVSSLMKIIDGDDEVEARKAKKMLAKHFAEEAKDGDGDDDGDGGEKKEAAAADDKPKEEAKAEDKPADSSAKMKAAAASTPDMVAMAREFHALKAQIAAEKDELTRQKIFSSRPDLAPEAIKALASVPTASLQKVIDTFPRIPNAAAAASVVGTRGDTQSGTGAPVLAPHIEDAIDIRMGRKQATAKVENIGHEQVLPLLTPEQARAALATLNGGK